MLPRGVCLWRYALQQRRWCAALAAEKGAEVKGGALAAAFKLGKLNHVAIATPDLEKTANLYRSTLKANVSEAHDQPEHGVKTVFVDLGSAKLELLNPIGDHSPIQHFLDKNKNGGLHHVCIEVANLEAAMAAMTAAGVRCLGAKPKVGAHGKNVIFLHPSDTNGVLIELEEE